MTRWIVLFSTLATLSCERHVRMVVPGTTDSQSYVCPLAKGGESPGPCVPATVDVPRMVNESGTTFFVAPRQCAGRIHQVLVRHAGARNPEVIVTCAPDESKIGDMK